MSVNQEQAYLYNGTVVKTAVVNGERFFSAKDVWKMLGLKWSGDQTTSKVPESQKYTVESNCYLSKVGLFNVILDNHNKPAAKPFWNWLSLEGLLDGKEANSNE